MKRHPRFLLDKCEANNVPHVQTSCNTPGVHFKYSFKKSAQWSSSKIQCECRKHNGIKFIHVNMWNLLHIYGNLIINILCCGSTSKRRMGKDAKENDMLKEVNQSFTFLVWKRL